MWAIAGVLLGGFFLASLLGFHFGPHSHAAAAGLGVLAAAWLVVIAVTGEATALLWTLLGADACLTAGVGLLAWRGLTAPQQSPISHRAHIVGKHGIASSALTPRGTVNLMGEEWSATSLNGDVEKGQTVQIIGVSGVHLEVWGERTYELDKGAAG